MSLPASFLDDLRARTPLSALIGRTVRLQKAGTEQRGCCPFHDEKSPSFYVNDSKAFAHCFGCGWNGDAIKFLTETRGLAFMDAVKELADAAGLEMPARDPQAAERDRERTAAHEIMHRAAMWFRDNLVGDRGAGARDYLGRRDISGLTIDQFLMGLALESPRGVAPLIRSFADVPVDHLVKVGLAGLAEERAEYYDFFRNRVMIPIHDQRGRVIAFGGRALGADKAKYLNTPDTPLFDKGRTLFNHHRAAPIARKAGRLFIVEGYMDVIALHRSGVPEAVAPNGTALTPAQLELAWALAPAPVLCFDGDRAGAAAAVRAAETALPLLQPGRTISIVTLPAGKDPDDIAREGGSAALQLALRAPAPLVDLLWHHHLAQVQQGTPDGKADLAGRLRRVVGTIRDATVRETYEAELRGRWEGLVETTRNPSRNSSRNYVPPSQTAATIRSNGMGGLVERAMIVGLMRFPDLVTSDAGDSLFRDPTCSVLYDVIVDSVIRGRASAEDVAADIERRGMGEAARQVRTGASIAMSFTTPSTPPAEARADLTTALAALWRR